MNSNNRNETKSDIFPWDIFKCDTISAFVKKYSSILMTLLSRSKYLSFITKVNGNNEIETKSDNFPWDIFKSDRIFFYKKVFKYFNDFQDPNILVL